MNRKLAFSTLALTALLAGCGRCGDDDHHGNRDRHGRADLEAAAGEVTQTEAGLLAAFKARDPAKVASFYTDDAVVATPGRAAARGPEAIAKITGDDFGDPAFSVDFTNGRTVVAAAGDIAYTAGTYRLTYTDPATRRVQSGAGNYVTLFRKQKDGSWKAVEDYAVPGAAEASPTLPLPPPKAGEAAAKTGG